MRRLVVFALLLLSARPARATNAGVALRWDACFGEGTGVVIKTFACDTNAGGERLVGSFSSGLDRPQVTGLEFVVDLSTSRPFAVGWPIGPPMPAWWTFWNAGSCRRSALELDVSANPANQVCQEWCFGQVLGGIATYTLDNLGTGTARLIMGAAAGPGASGAVVAGAEYSAFTLIISHANTVGAGVCSGCSAALFIDINALRVTTPSVIGEPSGDITLSGPLNGTDSHFVFWQGVPSPVPARTTTWGAVKSLYR